LYDFLKTIVGCGSQNTIIRSRLNLGAYSKGNHIVLY